MFRYGAKRHKYKLPKGFKAQFDDTVDKPRPKRSPFKKGKKKNGGSKAVWRYQIARQQQLYTPVKRYYLSDQPLDYPEFLKSPYWLKLRKEVLKERKSCEDCGLTKRLQLHHLYYYRDGRSVLYHEREHPGIFVVLCHDCHMRRHRTAEV